MSTSQQPDFLAGADAEELRELEAIGLRFHHATDGADEALSVSGDVSAIGGAAAFYFRRLRKVEESRALVRAIMQKELEMIARAYEPDLAAQERQIGYFLGKIEDLAKLADLAGGLEKRKTIKVSGGEFGKKLSPERVEIADAAEALAWAERTTPEAVRVTVQLPLSSLVDETMRPELPPGWVEKRREVLLKTLEEAGVNLSGEELPPGVVRQPAETRYIVKPAPVAGEEH